MLEIKLLSLLVKYYSSCNIYIVVELRLFDKLTFKAETRKGDTSEGDKLD